MDQITLVERELLTLGVPASITPEELRRYAKDILWLALEVKEAHELRTPLGDIQTAFEVDYNAELCEQTAAAIWKIAHDT